MKRSGIKKMSFKQPRLLQGYICLKQMSSIHPVGYNGLYSTNQSMSNVRKKSRMNLNRLMVKGIN